MTNGQTAELIALFAKKVSLDIPEGVAQGWIDNPRGFGKSINELLMPPPKVMEGAPSALTEADDWKAFYKKFFGLDVDLSAVRVPNGLERTIFIAEGISINMAAKAHTDRDIPFWKYCDSDIEAVVRESERGPVKTSYAIRVRKGQEADNDLRNLSAEDIAAKGIDTENLLERLVHGLKYYDETGKHLDVKNVTLCASSRYAGGDVPGVFRDDVGWVSVFWYDPQGRDSYLGARRSVR